MFAHRTIILVCATTIIALISSAPVAEAQVTGLRWKEVENTLDGFVTNDLLLDFSGRLSGHQLLVELASGSILQHPLGGSGPPHGAVVAAFPDLEFDTFVALGSPISGGPYGEPSLGGGAVGLGGAAAARFDTEQINQGWYPAANVNVSDQTDFHSARVTLSEDATGMWGIKSGAGGQSRNFYGPVADGRIYFDLPGDYDETGHVGQGDLDLVLLNWGRPAVPAPAGWRNNLPSGIVSQDELDPVLLRWGSRGEPNIFGFGSGQAIPEPGSIALAVMLFTIVLSAMRPSRGRLR